MNPGQQRAYLAQLAQKQNAAMAKIAALGGRELARLGKAHNALAVPIDELALSDTVPYVGAAALRATGLDGTGARIAILDSGIDYTHRNLGGPGTLAAYTVVYGTTAADARTTTLDGLFPTAKVIGRASNTRRIRSP